MKQNYPGSVASYNTRSGNEVGLFYNAPEPTRGRDLQRDARLMYCLYGRCGGRSRVRRRRLQPTGQQSWRPVLTNDGNIVHACPLFPTLDKGKGSPYSIAERRVLELAGSQPAGDVSHKPSGRLPLLSARPAVTFPARRPVPVSLLGEQRHDGCEQFA